MTQKIIEVLKECSECFNIEFSQKSKSDCPYRKNGFFMSKFSLNSQIKPSVSINPPLILIQQDKSIISQVFSLVRNDWATLQNKPYGEYAGRLLLLPRVNPITIFLNGYFLKTLNVKGA